MASETFDGLGADDFRIMPPPRLIELASTKADELFRQCDPRYLNDYKGILFADIKVPCGRSSWTLGFIARSTIEVPSGAFRIVSAGTHDYGQFDPEDSIAWRCQAEEFLTGEDPFNMGTPEENLIRARKLVPYILQATLMP